VLVATHNRELMRYVGRRAITLDHGQVVETS
jgi:ABC-type ATPase involved in cell division